MKSILFLCTGNSCRSQMAHGFANDLLSEQFNSFSAGTESHGLNPFAVKVMQEIGIDISQYQSQSLAEFNHYHFDYVVAVCDNAAKNCPVLFEGTHLIVHPFDDPPKLAKNATSADEALSYYREVRDQIKQWLISFSRQIDQGVTQ